jgi:hypothetical protein
MASRLGPLNREDKPIDDNLIDMRPTLPLSRNYDARNVSDPRRAGEVDWTRFNENFGRLLTTDWRQVNEGTSYGLSRRLLRLVVAYAQQRHHAIQDFDSKLRIFSRMAIPPNPNIVVFGAEVGWEAALIQALFGNGGKVLLIDSDPAAYQRFLNAPPTVRVRAPRGSKNRWLVVRRDTPGVEYLRRDFFDVPSTEEFDIGIDWGLIEHYPDSGKQAALAVFKKFLKPGGLHITSCPRNRLIVRLFYRAFSDELNLGYRELMSLDELGAHVCAAGCHPEDRFKLAAHNVVTWRQTS